MDLQGVKKVIKIIRRDVADDGQTQENKSGWWWGREFKERVAGQLDDKTTLYLNTLGT
jgi:hypothetical protein